MPITNSENPDGSIKAQKLSGAQTGTAPIYGARAWVNFNGTGTVAIRASGNVSSITDNGVGDYTVNFTIPMQDAGYSFTAIPVLDSTNVPYRNHISSYSDGAMAVGSLRLLSGFQHETTHGFQDVPMCCIAVFR